MSDKNEARQEGKVSVHVPYPQGLSPASRLTYRPANSTEPKTRAVECDPYVPKNPIPTHFVPGSRYKTATDYRYTAPLSNWDHLESGLETFDQEFGRDGIRVANVEILIKFKLTFFFYNANKSRGLSGPIVCQILEYSVRPCLPRTGAIGKQHFHPEKCPLKHRSIQTRPISNPLATAAKTRLFSVVDVPHVWPNIAGVNFGAKRKPRRGWSRALPTWSLSSSTVTRHAILQNLCRKPQELPRVSGHFSSPERTHG